MFQIAVCEDEQADRDNLIGILKSLLDKYIEEHRIMDFTSGGDLLQSGEIFCLIFMDIIMEGRNGIETGQELYSRNHSAKIIYTTNYGQYCMDAVNTVHAFAFLEKPVSEEALEEQLQAFLKQYRKDEVRLEFRNVSYEENGVLSEKPALTLPINTILYFANDLVTLRQKEEELLRDRFDGIDSQTAKNQILNDVFDRYMATRKDLAARTYAGC